MRLDSGTSGRVWWLTLEDLGRPLQQSAVRRTCHKLWVEGLNSVIVLVLTSTFITRFRIQELRTHLFKHADEGWSDLSIRRCFDWLSTFREIKDNLQQPWQCCEQPTRQQMCFPLIKTCNQHVREMKIHFVCLGEIKKTTKKTPTDRSLQYLCHTPKCLGACVWTVNCPNNWVCLWRLLWCHPDLHGSSQESVQTARSNSH